MPERKVWLARTMSSKKRIFDARRKDLPQLKRVLEEKQLDVGSEPLGSEGETALHVACAHGHLDIVQYLVNDRGCSVAAPNSRAVGSTPLEVAWANEHWEVVEFLLEAIQGKELFAEVGLAPTTVTQLQEVAKCRDEALHQACIHGYLEVVKFLTCGDYLHLMDETVTSHGTTPLQVAWEKKHWEVASYLLQILQAVRKGHGGISGPSPTLITQLLEVVAFGKDAFHVACSRGVLDTVRYLHESLKCSLTQQNAQGETPLDVARLNGHLHVIHFLLESGECSARDMTKLHIACMRRDEEKVRNLAGDINSLSNPDKYGITAVHYATFQPENLRILVSIAERRNMLSVLEREDGKGNTPLHYAALSGCIKSVMILVSYYKSVNMHNSNGDTPLRLSILSNYSDSDLVRQIILHESCQPGTLNALHKTTLHFKSEHSLVTELLWFTVNCSREKKKAIKTKFLLHEAIALGRLTFVQELMKVSGYNINQFNSDGETPLHVACRYKYEVFELLTADSRCDLNAQNRNGLTALHIAIATGWFNKCELLLTNVKCNPNIFHSDESIPLHMLIAKKYCRLLSILLKHPKCNPNITNRGGNSALHLAVRKCAVECTTYLLQHERIDPNIQNEIGNTPLHEVVITRAPIEIMESLILHIKVNPNMRNNEGNSALHLAVRKHSLRRATYLLQHERIDPNVQNKTGNTPLHEVIITGAPTDIMESLIQHKNVNPNVKNNEGNSALHLAVKNHSVHCATFLLQHKELDPNIQNHMGNTPLHEGVVTRAPIEIIKLIIPHKTCNPCIKNGNEETPLQIASKTRLPQYFIALVASGKHTQEEIKDAVTTFKYLLHQTVSLNDVLQLKSLQNIVKCDVNEANQDGETPLHIACRQCSIEVVQVLVADKRCNLNAKNSTGESALHIAVYSELNSVQKVRSILPCYRCNPNITNSEGYTPLHYAIRRKEFEIAAALVRHVKVNLNAQDNDGNTPLHEAVMGGTPVDVVKSLTLHKNCNPNKPNHEGMTPLQISVDLCKIHYAEVLITSGKCSHEDIVKTTEGTPILHQAVSSHNIEFLTALRNAGVNMNMSNSNGETALHIACREGNIEVTQLLLQSKANVLAADNKGNASIHLACTHSNFECLSLLLGHPKCNPNQQNAVGDTPLHILCSYGQDCDMKMLHTLLSTPGINPECANHAGQIPAELAKSNYSAIEVISKCLEHKDEQLETYLKIFVVGNSGGGKSTLIKAIKTQRSRSIKNSFKAKHVKPREVPPHTAGIVPLSFNSKHFGHAVLYDFAGQHEYYSSHAAVMENLVLPSPPLFLLLVDISKPMDEIKIQLVYWWMFINNHSKQTTASPHVILVGSHKDIVKERGENVQKTMEQITNIVRDIPVSFQFDCSKAFPLDCRKLVSQGLTALLTQLKLTCQALRQTADIDLHCHILKAFLTTNFHNSTACEFPEIVERMKSEDDLLPQKPSQLIPLLSTLSDKGYILLLQNHTDVNKSWVILKPELLLAEVNGSIFAPDDFKEHCSEFAMSTGVVALSNIRKEFVNYSSQVIIGYLTHLEFCFRIKDRHTLEMITKDATLQLKTHGSEHADEFYFFPALIQKEIPLDVCQPQETIKYVCGWFYRCNEPAEQLTTRFLHVLILRLAFSCDPPDEPTERESVVLLRRCSVWKHGIAWLTNDGIETIVEVGLQCRWVAVMLRCPDTHKVQCAELRTKVISTVLKTKQDFCPAIDMKEFLIAPSSLQYPFEGRELTLYSMKEIAKVVIMGKEFPIDTEGKNTIPISQLLPFEPFFNFGEDLIGNLFTSDEPRKREVSQLNLFQIANKCFNKLNDFKKALQPNEIAFQRECVKPDCTEVDRCVAMFQIIQRRGCKTWRDFEQEFSRFSIFCGRHPMVSLMLQLQECFTMVVVNIHFCFILGSSIRTRI